MLLISFRILSHYGNALTRALATLPVFSRLAFGFRLLSNDRYPLGRCPSAARMRRHRERIKRGGVFVRFEMVLAAVERLIALGWLRPEARDDAYAVTSALIDFGTQALWPDPVREVTRHIETRLDEIDGNLDERSKDRRSQERLEK